MDALTRSALRMFRGVVPALFACVWTAATGAATSGCGSSSALADPAASAGADESGAGPGPSASGSSAGTAPSTWSAADEAAAAACSAQREAALKEAELPGAPAYEKVRAEMARVRGRPLVWRRAPAPSPELEARVAKVKGSPLQPVRDLIHKHRKDPAALRRAVLREGYLFHEDVEVGLALVEQLSLVRLFDEPEIWLQRGALIMPLKRMPKDKQYFLPERYVYTAGDRPGAQAEILHGDRVAVTRAEVEKDVLSLDVFEAAAVGGFDRVKPERLTASALTAQVRYGADVWVPAVLAVDGPRLRIGCEVLTAELAQKKQAFLAEDRLERMALRRLRDIVRLEIDEELPFDAPRSGEEAAEGDLRREFDRAYKQGLRYFSVDAGRRHDVYDEKGRALPPQVCIDFLVDTLERAGGKWYAPMQGSPLKPAPERSKGLLDFDGMSLDNRRSVASFVAMAKSHGDLFDVWDNPTRIPFVERTEFFNYLAANPDALDPLDLVIIFGMKNGKPHYHSMIVLEKDPVSGVPTLIVSNAVVPREQTLEGIMHISPKRSIKHRIRLKHTWVAALASLAKDVPPGEAPTD